MSPARAPAAEPSRVPNYSVVADDGRGVRILQVDPAALVVDTVISDNVAGDDSGSPRCHVDSLEVDPTAIPTIRSEFPAGISTYRVAGDGEESWLVRPEIHPAAIELDHAIVSYFIVGDDRLSHRDR